MRTPIGMVIVGVLTGLLALAFCLFLSVLDPLSESGTLAARACVSILAALAFVAAEAILFVRPWFYRASKTLVVAWLLAVLTMCVKGDGVGQGLCETLVATVLSFIVIGPIMSYLGEKNRLMPRHPRAFVRATGSRGTP